MQAAKLVKTEQANKQARHMWWAAGLLVVGATVVLFLLLAGDRSGTASSESMPIADQELAYRIYRAGEWRLNGTRQAPVEALQLYRAGERTSYGVTSMAQPAGWEAYRAGERASHGVTNMAWPEGWELYRAGERTAAIRGRPTRQAQG